MVDYSKWDNLDSDISDSDSDIGEAAQRQVRHGDQHMHCTQGRTDSTGSAVGGHIVEAEALRLRGNSAFERGDITTAMGAYEAQLQLLEGLKDEKALEMTRAALLNQASGLIRLQKFGEAEARCTRLLDSAGPAGVGRGVVGVGDTHTRALHFRGFARLRQGLFEGARSDLNSALAAGDPGDEEARALLTEADAGLALSSCRDPEAKGRALLIERQPAEAAKYFREAASRARRRLHRSAQHTAGSSEGGSVVEVALARNLRMKGIAVSASGDLSSAELLLRGGLKELRCLGGDNKTRTEALVGEEGMMLSALGRVRSRQRKHQAAVETMREAVDRLEDTIARATTRQNTKGHKIDEECTDSSTPPTPPVTSTATRARYLTSFLSQALACLGSELLKAQSHAEAGAERDSSSGPLSAVNAKISDDCRPPPTNVLDEAVRILERALSLMKAEMANDSTGAVAGRAIGVDGAAEDFRLHGDRENARHQVATVLDSLSEAYARGKRWEKARSAAEQAVTAWRSLDDPLRAGAAASLLSLGHIMLQLHGVGAVLDEASARWEEAVTFVDASKRPLEAADMRLKVAGFYSTVVRSDPSRLESLEAKIAGHYMAAAGLLARAREQNKSMPEHGAGKAQGVAIEALANVESFSPLELAEKEAFALEGYAGAVGDDHDKAIKALRKASKLLELANVSERGESWILRKVGVLQDLALALAKNGEHAIAEEKLLDAIAEMKQLDNAGTEHREAFMNLHKYLVVARRARGDMLGAKKALERVESLGGSAGRKEVEDLNCLLAHNRISTD